jgi:hypothetical protein
VEIEAETEGDNERSEESKKKNMNMWCPISYKNTLFFFFSFIWNFFGHFNNIITKKIKILMKLLFIQTQIYCGLQ